MLQKSIHHVCLIIKRSCVPGSSTSGEESLSKKFHPKPPVLSPKPNPDLVKRFSFSKTNAGDKKEPVKVTNFAEIKLHRELQVEKEEDKTSFSESISKFKTSNLLGHDLIRQEFGLVLICI